MKKICVYCGSSQGNQPVFMETAKTLGKLLVENNIELVYGGGNIGLMGKIADTVLKHGGRATGVITEFLNSKVPQKKLSELHVVETMHERKELMFNLSDGFIAMPGGIGTIEEIFEVLTWAQLGSHFKPCGFLNVANYYEMLFNFLDNAFKQQFIKEEQRYIFLSENSPLKLLEKMKNYQPEPVFIEKWFDKTA